MNAVTPFVISQFTNPSGEIVFRVSGWLDGQRVRKNFSTRTEAEAERQALKLALIQAETGIRTAATRLTDEQLKEAEGGFLRLEGRTRSLSFYLDYALANYRDPIRDMPLAEAAKEYLALREADFNQGRREPLRNSSRRLVVALITTTTKLISSKGVVNWVPTLRVICSVTQIRSP